jgi:uncharacterized OsmC-like protein
MLQHGKQKIKQAVLHPDLMQVLYDELLAEQPQTMATITYSVTGQSSANSTFTTLAGQLSIVTAQHAGSKQYPDPAELLLAAYAASFAQVLQLAAEEQLIELNGITVTASGNLDPAWFLGLAKTTRAGLQKIQLTVKVNSTANPEELVNLLQTARDRSPVADNITGQTPAGFTLELPEVLAN